MRIYKLGAYLALALIFPFYLFFLSYNEIKKDDGSKKLDTVSTNLKRITNDLKLLLSRPNISHDFTSTNPDSTQKMLSQLVSIYLTQAKNPPGQLGAAKNIAVNLKMPDSINIPVKITEAKNPNNAGEITATTSYDHVYDFSVDSNLKVWRITIIKQKEFERKQLFIFHNSSPANTVELDSLKSYDASGPPSPYFNLQKNIQVLPLDQTILVADYLNCIAGEYVYQLKGEFIVPNKKKRLSKTTINFTLPIIITLRD